MRGNVGTPAVGMNGLTLAMGLREAAAAVGLSHWTLRKAIRESKLKSIRINRRVLVSPDALRDYLSVGHK